VKKLLALIVALHLAVVGWALPSLQLDITNSTAYYDSGSESTVSGAANFTLRALFKGEIKATEIWYISAAISPRLDYSNPAPNFGSYTVNGTTYTAANMYYGTPPVSDLLENDGGGDSLAKHDHFPSYFSEHAFKFTTAQTVPAYNVQTNSTSPGVLYYVDFNIDVTGLTGIYELHFDLYTDKVKKQFGWTIDDFAPFSKDAESGGYDKHVSVPDSGSTLILLGLSLLSLGLIGRRAFRR
jgi:hypothetical protein